MYSYRQFTPGSNTKCGKLIKYAGVVNSNPNNPNLKICNYTNNEIINKSSLRPNISNAQRISGVINNTVGGSTQFGNYYLGEPVIFNFLGRVEGQPGGSGAPLRNRF